jgi:hypothetical protein
MTVWTDFNDATATLEDRLPTAGHSIPTPAAPDLEQIKSFLSVAFSYCEGLIPVRGFVDQGQGLTIKPHNIWIPADATAPELLATYAAWAAREGSAVYVIPGTVAEHGQARAEHVLQMQAMVVDLDTGDIAAKLSHLLQHLGEPTLIVESGGRTAEGAAKLHVWWKLTEPAEGA